VASGYRASKVIGSTVYNESRDAIGTIDDLIESPKDKVSLGLRTHVPGMRGGADSFTADRLAPLAVERLRTRGHEAGVAPWRQFLKTFATPLPRGKEVECAEAMPSQCAGH
jgi:hypothetical protein